LRERFILEVLDVSIRILPLAESLPVSGYHRALVRTKDGFINLAHGAA
jgi:hypothetical protein